MVRADLWEPGQIGARPAEHVRAAIEHGVQRGATDRELAETLETSIGTVGRLRKLLGHDRPRKGRSVSDELLRQLLAAGLDALAISIRTGLQRATITARLRKLGESRPMRTCKVTVAFTIAQDAELRAEAERLGVGRADVVRLRCFPGPLEATGGSDG